MTSRADNENLLLRARDPEHLTATGDIYARDTRGLVTSFNLTAGAGANATAVIRDGGASGTIVWAMSALAATSQPQEFPSGLKFTDGLHLTLSGASATFNVAGTDEANPS